VPEVAAVRLRVPDGNVLVPLSEFETVWTRAEALFRDRPASRYLGGVCAACRWVAAYPGAVSPLRRKAAAATAELILREDMAATLAADGEAVEGAAVDERWAAGVAMTLGWARGALTGDPLRPAARDVDDDGHERDNGRER
jgi:hypothetical protein